MGSWYGIERTKCPHLVPLELLSLGAWAPRRMA